MAVSAAALAAARPNDLRVNVTLNPSGSATVFAAVFGASTRAQSITFLQLAVAIAIDYASARIGTAGAKSSPRIIRREPAP
jgi:hypothetical protein